MTETLQYLTTLSTEEAVQAVEAMSPEAKQMLTAEIFSFVSTMSRTLVQNADEIWENK